jgi:hypothetical protein
MEEDYQYWAREVNKITTANNHILELLASVLRNVKSKKHILLFSVSAAIQR